jgi:serine/threonine protein kinase
MIPGLLVTEGLNKGRYIQFPEKEPFWIGRSEEMDFKIPKDSVVSNRHCYFLRTGESLCMKDQSRNGTRLNNRKIHNSWAILKLMDIVCIGHTHFQVIDVDANSPEEDTTYDIDAIREDYEKSEKDAENSKTLTALGPYRNIEMIGSGAFGVVYKSLHEDWNKLVALKVFTGKEEPDDRFMGRFLREANLLKKLTHPSLIQLYDAGRIEKGNVTYNYIATEYFPGVNLHYHLKIYGAMSWSKVVRILHQILQGLIHMHANNVIHRDIKPENILYNDIKQVAKLIDLGLGKSLTDEDRSTFCITKTGSGLGTPYYMPIEQWKEAKSAREPADIYALGATVYDLLTGFPPYGECKDDLEVFQAVRAQKLTPLERLCSEGTPLKLIDVIKTMMAYDPTDRYGSAQEVLEELKEFI